jgi:nucleoside-diphosphate kinase
VSEGTYPDIIESIVASGFNINTLELFYMDKNEATEFLEVYKGVVPEYHGLVEQLSSGTCIVLEIAKLGNSQKNVKGSLEEQKEENDSVVNEFRAFTGPSDPVIARTLRPNTLRAKFGANKIKNAVHCTDLPEDGVLESEFFFNIMQAKGQR